MREILFRGKRSDNDEWVYGYLLQMFGELSIMDPYDENMIFPVIHKTVGQYTGETDRYNNRIFEGDILRGLFDYNAVRPINALVEFHDGSFGVRENRCGCNRFTAFTSFCNVEWEKIGNIHDNPELWEEEQ